MKQEKVLQLCQTPSDVRRFLEENPNFIDKILIGVEGNIHTTIRNIIVPKHHGLYPTDHKEFLSPKDKIKELKIYTPYVASSKVEDNVYDALNRYQNIGKSNVIFQKLGDSIDNNKKLIEWILHDDSNQIVENIFGEDADQRFEIERLGLSNMMYDNNFDEHGSMSKISKQLPVGYFVDKDNQLYQRDNSKKEMIQMVDTGKVLQIKDYNIKYNIFITTDMIYKVYGSNLKSIYNDAISSLNIVGDDCVLINNNKGDQFLIDLSKYNPDLPLISQQIDKNSPEKGNMADITVLGNIDKTVIFQHGYHFVDNSLHMFSINKTLSLIAPTDNNTINFIEGLLTTELGHYDGGFNLELCNIENKCFVLSYQQKGGNKKNIYVIYTDGLVSQPIIIDEYNKDYSFFIENNNLIIAYSPDKSNILDRLFGKLNMIRQKKYMNDYENGLGYIVDLKKLYEYLQKD